MFKALQISKIILVLAAAFMFAAIGITVVKSQPQVSLLLTHANGVLTRFEAVESKIYATASNADKATDAWAKSAKDQAAAVTGLTSDVHNTLGNADKAIQGVNAAVDTLNDQEKHVGPLLDSTRQDLDEVSNMLESQIPPVLDQTSEAMLSVNDFLKKKELADIAANVDAMTKSGAGILADGQKVTDKMTADYLAPKPPWVKIGKFALDTYDIAAMIARHTP